MKLSNMKIATRLGLGFGIVLFLLLIVGIIGYLGITAVSGTTEKIIKSDAKISEDATRARANVVGLRRYEKDLYINIASKEKQDEYLEKWKSEFEHLTGRLNNLEKVVSDQKDKESIKVMKSELVNYESGFKRTLDGIHSGKIKTTQDGNNAIGEYKDAIHKLEGSAKDLAEDGVKRMEAATPVIGNIKTRSVSFSLGITLIAILFGVASAVWIVRSITKPLNTALTVANKVADGDLTVDIEATSNDETGQLLAAMKNMTEKLKVMVSGIRQASASVASGSHQLSASSEEITRTMNDQSSRASQIASSAEEMAQTVIDIAKNSSNIATSANDTASIAQMGADVVNKSVSESKSIAATVESSAMVIQNLGDKSKQIGEIISTIKDIADQTNLLALNAAIEAARAGEQGRGFAVVADEVRKLAERTAKATSEIGSMITAIQGEVDNAVVAMDKTNKQVEVGLQYSVEAGNQLNTIVSSVTSLQGMVQQIATATEEMSTTSEAISGDIQEISTGAREISGGSEQVAQASSELARLAGELKVIVEQFRV